MNHSRDSLRTHNLFKLSWPILVQNVSLSLVIFVDFWFYSQLSNETAAVIGQLQPVTWLGTFIIPVFASTGISVASQFLGAGQMNKVVPTYMTNILFSFTLGFAIASGFFILKDQIGLWMNMTPELNQIASRYISLMAFFFLTMAIGVAYQAILSSRGLTQWSMYISFVTNGVNLILDAIFVWVFHWDLDGVVLASISANITALCIVLWLVHKKLKIHFYIKGFFQDMLKVLRPMLRIGIPNALEPFSYSVQQIFLSAMIISMGLVAMAANSYTLRLINFAIMICFSLTSGGQILMAHYMGERKFNRVNHTFWFIIAVTMTISLINSVLLWSFSNTFFYLFTKNPEILRAGKSLLLIAIFMEPARAINIVGGISFRAVGDARFPLIISMIFIWGILPIIFFINTNWPLSIFAMWICFAVDEIIRGSINLWRWSTGKWRNMGFTQADHEKLSIKTYSPEPISVEPIVENQPENLHI